MARNIFIKPAALLGIVAVVSAAIALQEFNSRESESPNATARDSARETATPKDQEVTVVEKLPDLDGISEADEEITEIVHGLRVYKDRNCTVQKRYVDIGDGTIVEGFSCVPNAASEPGSFDAIPNDALAVMSYSDPSAAEELGKRLVETDPEQSYELLLRSVALRPDNARPILWLADQSYSLTTQNGQPAITSMSTNYVLARVAEELGTEGMASSMRRNLEDAGLDRDGFDRLESRVRDHLKQIEEIRSEVGLDSIQKEQQS